jgi:hypothetical protein
MLSSVEHLGTIVAINLRLLLGAWGFAVLPWASPRIAMVVVLMAVVALVLVARPRRPSLAALYCGIYVPAILVLPYPDTARYALPIVPFLIAWTVGGLRAVTRGHPAGTLVLGAIVASAVVVDVRPVLRPPGERTTEVEFRAMTDWIAANLPSDAILVGAWDAPYHLFTGRRAIRPSVNDNLRIYYVDAVATEFPDARELADAFQRMRACYFVRDAIIGGGEAVFFRGLMNAIEAAAPAPFEPIYQSASGGFAIRRRTDCPASGAS